MHLTFLQMIRFIRSATPFCSGVYRIVNSNWILLSLKNSSISFNTYSLPLSHRNLLIFRSKWTVAIASSFQVFQCFWLMFHNVAGSKMNIIIDKSNYIFLTFTRYWRNRPHNITMYQLQGPYGITSTMIIMWLSG